MGSNNSKEDKEQSMKEDPLILQLQQAEEKAKQMKLLREQAEEKAKQMKLLREQAEEKAKQAEEKAKQMKLLLEQAEEKAKQMKLLREEAEEKAKRAKRKREELQQEKEVLQQEKEVLVGSLEYFQTAAFSAGYGLKLVDALKFPMLLEPLNRVSPKYSGSAEKKQKTSNTNLYNRGTVTTGFMPVDPEMLVSWSRVNFYKFLEENDQGRFNSLFQNQDIYKQLYETMNGGGVFNPSRNYMSLEAQYESILNQYVWSTIQLIFAKAKLDCRISPVPKFDSKQASEIGEEKQVAIRADQFIQVVADGKVQLACVVEIKPDFKHPLHRRARGIPQNEVHLFDERGIFKGESENLLPLWMHSESYKALDGATYCSVRQAVTYMAETGIRYSIICTLERWSFLRYDDETKKVLVAGPFYGTMHPGNKDEYSLWNILIRFILCTSDYKLEAGIIPGHKEWIQRDRKNQGASGSNNYSGNQLSLLPFWTGPISWGMLWDIRYWIPGECMEEKEKGLPLPLDPTLLGEGRTGRIYRNAINEKDMIIKVLNYEHPLLHQEEPELIREEIKNELRVYQELHTLQGKRVPKLYFAGEMQPGFIDCVCTSYEGESLKEEQEISISFYNEALQTLKEIHSLGVLHNDIALRNILINKQQQPIFIDFGCSIIKNKKKSLFEKEIKELQDILSPLMTTKVYSSTNKIEIGKKRIFEEVNTC